MSATQDSLFGDTIPQRWEKWKLTPGGRHLRERFSRKAYRFGLRYRRTGQRVSADFIVHQLRDRLAEIRSWFARKNVSLPREGGYAINDHFTSYLARDFEAHRPEFAGMFERRELGAHRTTERTTITRERIVTPKLEKWPAVAATPSSPNREKNCDGGVASTRHGELAAA